MNSDRARRARGRRKASPSTQVPMTRGAWFKVDLVLARTALCTVCVNSLCTVCVNSLMSDGIASLKDKHFSTPRSTLRITYSAPVSHVSTLNAAPGLLHLGSVINALSRGLAHIPYRNSILTRILQVTHNRVDVCVGQLVSWLIDWLVG